MSSTGQATLIVFTRVPVPGRIKTRLHATLTENECASLHESMTFDLIEKCTRLGNPIVLCYSDEWVGIEDGTRIRDSFLARAQEVAGSHELRYLAQEGSDLGSRMANAIEAVLAEGADACLLMGCDLPYIMRHDIEFAQQSLSYSDVVFAPSKDGGYWLVGMKEPFAEVFEEKKYGGKSVLTEAIASCRAHGRKVTLARETFDVDTPYDFERLCNQVRTGDFRIGPRTFETVERIMAEQERARPEQDAC